MQSVLNRTREAEEDIFFGQAVIIWARWFLIAAATALVLTSFDDQNSLITGTLPIVALMGMNFFLHGRYLTEKPVSSTMLVATSCLDLVIVTLLVAFWPLQETQTRLDNPFYLFYFPLVLAFAFVMPRRIEVIYTGAAILLYALVIVTSGDLNHVLAHPEYASGQAVEVNVKTMLLRLIALGAVGGLANYYWRIQRVRRRATLGVS